MLFGWVWLGLKMLVSDVLCFVWFGQAMALMMDVYTLLDKPWRSMHEGYSVSTAHPDPVYSSGDNSDIVCLILLTGKEGRSSKQRCEGKAWSAYTGDLCGFRVGLCLLTRLYVTCPRS